MLEAWMGEEKFRHGVREYLGKWAWTNARAEDLWNTLSEAAGSTVDTLMAGFLDRPGVPLVEVEVAGKTLHLKQKRFLVSGDAPSDGRPWKIPMVFHCRSGAEEYHARYLLESAEAEFTPGTGDITLCHPNLDERGYYRWNLAGGVMDSLAAMAPGFLSERERVGLVGNLTALSKAGILPADILLERFRGLAGDTSAQLLLALGDGLREVDSDLIDSASAGDFAA